MRRLVLSVPLDAVADGPAGVQERKRNETTLAPGF
jgi:hypothetical protein